MADGASTARWTGMSGSHRTTQAVMEGAPVLLSGKKSLNVTFPPGTAQQRGCWLHTLVSEFLLAQEAPIKSLLMSLLLLSLLLLSLLLMSLLLMSLLLAQPCAIFSGGP